MTLLNPRHAARYADLAKLLVKYGRRDLVRGVGWDELVSPNGERPKDQQPKAEALAADLERMGPTYVKLGQLLATRVDLFPEAYTQALARLQDDVEPVPFAEIEQVITAELGIRVKHAFEWFDQKPMAAASLGQVHRARLHGGREVVVKVLRPGVRERVRDDMAALGELATFADEHTDIGRRFGFAALFNQFRRMMAAELDYLREAANLTRVRDVLRDNATLIVPQPVPDYTTNSVLTMDYIAGRKVTDIGPLGRLDIDGGDLVDALLDAYLSMILVDGFFHADPHPGNVLLTDDNRLALIDLGMVHTVPSSLQDKLVKLLLAVSDGDGEQTATVLAQTGHRTEDFDEPTFREAVGDLVSRSVALGSHSQAGAILLELSRICAADGLVPPPEMAMIGKALLSLDQVTRHLDPDFEPAEAVRRRISEILQTRMRPSPAGLLASAMEAKDFATHLPGRLNRLMDAISQGSFGLKVDVLDEVRFLHILQRMANRLASGMVLAALIVGAALMMQIPTESKIFGYPAIAMVFFTLAALGGTLLLISAVAGDRRVERRPRSGKAS